MLIFILILILILVLMLMLMLPLALMLMDDANPFILGTDLLVSCRAIGLELPNERSSARVWNRFDMVFWSRKCGEGESENDLE
jgi:hypothetical protein